MKIIHTRNLPAESNSPKPVENDEIFDHLFLANCRKQTGLKP